MPVGPYRKRPVVIRALQWTGENQQEVVEFVPSEVLVWKPIGRLAIKTLEGEMEVPDDGWIIEGVEREFYPCSDSIFRATYEEVS